MNIAVMQPPVIIDIPKNKKVHSGSEDAPLPLSEKTMAHMIMLMLTSISSESGAGRAKNSAMTEYMPPMPAPISILPRRILRRSTRRVIYRQR